MRIVNKISKCPRCRFFSAGFNDPECYHPLKPLGVRPNSGIYADDGPPENCPLRGEPLTEVYTVEDK